MAEEVVPIYQLLMKQFYDAHEATEKMLQIVEEASEEIQHPDISFDDCLEIDRTAQIKIEQLKKMIQIPRQIIIIRQLELSDNVKEDIDEINRIGAALRYTLLMAKEADNKQDMIGSYIEAIHLVTQMEQIWDRVCKLIMQGSLEIRGGKRKRRTHRNRRKRTHRKRTRHNR